MLRLEEHELGEPGPGEVLLDVEAIGLNRSEANFRRDRYLDRVASLPSGLGYYRLDWERRAASIGVIGRRRETASGFFVRDFRGLLAIFTANHCLVTERWLPRKVGELLPCWLTGG